MRDPASAAYRCLRVVLLILLAVGIAVMHTAPPMPAQALPAAGHAPGRPMGGHSMAMPAVDPGPAAATGTTARRAASTGIPAVADTPTAPAAPSPPSIPCGHPGRLVCLSTLPQPVAAGGLPGLLTLLTLALPVTATASYTRTGQVRTDGAALDWRPPPDLFALGVLRT